MIVSYIYNREEIPVEVFGICHDHKDEEYWCKFWSDNGWREIDSCYASVRTSTVVAPNELSEWTT